MRPGGHWRHVVPAAIAVLGAAAICSTAYCADAPVRQGTGHILMAGSADIIWLVRRHEEPAAFDLIIRRPGGKWDTLSRVSGRPTAIAADGKRLNVLSAAASAYVFSLSDEFMLGEGQPTPGADWPERAGPVAICKAPQPGESSFRRFVAVVPRPRPALSSQPATATASSRPGGESLTLLQTVNGQWKEFTRLDNAGYTDDSRVSVAAVDESLYVLVANKTAGASRLAVRRPVETEDGPVLEWLPDLKLPDGPERPLAVRVVRGRAILVTIVPPAGTGKTSGGYTLRIYDLSDPETADNAQVITSEGQPLALQGDWPPLTGSFGKRDDEKLALLWYDDDGYHFATCGLNGNVVDTEQVDELLKTGRLLDTQKIVMYFMLGILGAVLATIVIGRGTAPPEPLVFPTGFVPGSLLKRLLALIIDQMPFSILSMVICGILRPDLTPEEIVSILTANRSHLPAEPVLCVLGATAAWVIYGAAMEARFGTTLGKMVMRLEVVSSLGKKPKIHQAILRNLTKPIELIPYMLIFTMAVPLLSRSRRRLGDFMARTAVVDKRPPVEADEMQDSTAPPPPPGP